MPMVSGSPSGFMPAILITVLASADGAMPSAMPQMRPNATKSAIMRFIRDPPVGLESLSVLVHIPRWPSAALYVARRTCVMTQPCRYSRQIGGVRHLPSGHGDGHAPMPSSMHPLSGVIRLGKTYLTWPIKFNVFFHKILLGPEMRVPRGSELTAGRLGSGGFSCHAARQDDGRQKRSVPAHERQDLGGILIFRR